MNLKQNIFNIFKIVIGNESLLRKIQKNLCSKLFLKGLTLEFGVVEKKSKNFSNFIKGKTNFEYSNYYQNKKLKIFSADLTKKLKIKSNKYNNILLFNVLEHLPEYNSALSEINRILKKNGKFVGSTPFIYQIHSAPNDYFRFTKKFFEFELKKNKFCNIKVEYMGYGPLTACYSLIFAYVRFLPIFCQLLLLVCMILDSFLQIFVRTELKEIFPVGIFFIAQKK